MPDFPTVYPDSWAKFHDFGGDSGGNNFDAILTGVSNDLIMLDLLAFGPSGEDIVPAMILMSFRTGAKQSAKPALPATEGALSKVHGEVGKLPRGAPGKFGSPQRGTPRKGYRRDPAHPSAKPGSPDAGPHINWWDYTGGKRGAVGMGLPQTILANRYASHHRRAAGFTTPRLDSAGQGFSARLASRGREQQLIDFHGGALSEGGYSGNLIRGVSRWNPQGRIYHESSDLFFDPLSPYTGSFQMGFVARW